MRGGNDAYRAAITALQSGELIGVFPEAGVDASFTVRALKTGAARLAREAGVPLIPIAIWGGQRILTKAHPMRLGERFGIPVVFVVGPPIGVDGEIHDVTARLRTDLQALVAEAQATYPVDGRGEWWQPRHLGGTAPTPEEAVELDRRIAERRSSKTARG
jgi:1-acyl-sn-glycerol-3-phosphate acyltransferase